MNLLTFTLAWQQLKANWKAGDLRVLLMALILAIAAITAVGGFSQRISANLYSQGSVLLGGDLAVFSDHALPATYSEYAKSLGLSVAQTAEFPSMVFVDDKNQLAEIKALGDGFPLRGDFAVQTASAQSANISKQGPAIGEVWLEPRLVSALGLQIGDVVEVGAKSFNITGVIQTEPSRGGDMFSFAPRLMMHLQDVAGTELIQYGSRVKYQLVVAGDAAAVAQLSAWLQPQLQRGERLEDVKTARPEIKSAIEKAEIFLGLSSMVSVVLSVIAMLLASGPFVSRNLDTFAMLRCFGAGHALIRNIMIWQTLLVAAIGGLLGCALGYVLQAGLATLAATLFVEVLAPVTLQPFLLGFAVSVCVMLTLMWPHLMAIQTLTTVRILRREVEVDLRRDWLTYIPVALLVFLLIWLQASTLQLAAVVSLGLLVASAIVGVLAYALVQLLFKLKLSSQHKPQNKTLAALQIGLSNLKRRIRLSIAQMIAFGLGLMVIVLLSIVRTDLMDSWQASLPADAPNRFVINLQKAQLPAFTQTFANQGMTQPPVFPMVRGRLTQINNQAINLHSYPSERAKRLAAREFNLSMAATMQEDNRLLAGQWWQPQDAGKPYVSIEQDIASNLNIKVGDTLTYDITGVPLTLTVTSIRKVEWDSMRANFFAVTPPLVLEPFMASYMTAFYLPREDADFVNQLLKQFPNLTVIDVAALMEQVRAIMQKMSVAVAYVFLFSLVSGLAVLYAALIATKTARIRESTLLRVLGASRQQVSWAMMAEFLCIALVAVLVAVVLANSMAFYISRFMLDIPYQLNLSIAFIAIGCALVFIPLSAWWVVRQYLNQPPKQLLNSI